MRIGIDLRSLEGGAQHRGIGRYASDLIHSLSEIDKKNEYVFFLSHPKAKPPVIPTHRDFKPLFAHGKGQGLRGIKYIRIVYITPRPLNVDRYNVDVFLHIDTSQPIRFKTTPVVSVVYDLIPFIYKEQYQHVHLGGYTPGHLIGYSRIRLKWRILEKWLQLYAKSTKVISISEHSKKDLLAFVPSVNPKNVIPIPLAAGKLPTISAVTAEKMKHEAFKNFVFYVGGADPRKGLVSLVESFEDVWKENPNAELVLAGKEVTDSRVPEAAKLHAARERSSNPEKIHLLGFITDEELAWLYKNAEAFVFPSSYEGFGLPILEAMQAGCPVITYDNSSLPEVAARAAIVLKDGSSMAPSICKLLSDKNLREKLRAKGKKQAMLFTWKNTAIQTLNVLEKAAKQRKEK